MLQACQWLFMIPPLEVFCSYEGCVIGEAGLLPDYCVNEYKQLIHAWISADHRTQDSALEIPEFSLALTVVLSMVHSHSRLVSRL